MCPIKITIATVTYNAEETLQRTLDSVAEQTYAGIEHLIIDGCSKDRTMELIHRYVDDNTGREVTHDIVVVREPDKGLYDAMNKALENATGDYIVFLNAGDRLHSPDTLSQAFGNMEATAGHRPAIVYGETDLVDGEGRFIRHRRLQAPARLNWKSFRWGMLVCHQSFYVRTDLARQTPFTIWTTAFGRLRLVHPPDETCRTPPATYCQQQSHPHGLPARRLTTQNRKASLWERFHIMAHHYGLPATLVQHGLITIRAVFKK